MRRSARGGLLLLALLAGCSRPEPAAEAQAAAPVCRVGPDGGPVADKGIGGTGAPWLVDRGIGGTGGPALADRGIGGTGIVAAITGFGSICLAGQEVALPAGTPVVLGAEPGSADALRAGQIAIVDAGPADGGLTARRVTVRFEVSGPVEAVAGDRLRVAGQDVALTAQTAGPRPAIGDWVAVSGFRRPDGTVDATRLTPRPPGPVELHGVLRQRDGVYRIGAAVIAPMPALATLVDRSVVVTGPLLLGEVQPESARPDLLVSDPAAYFGPSVDVVLFEAYGQLGDGRLRLGPGFSVPVFGRIEAGPLRVYRLERSPAGLRAVDRPGLFGPAPTAAGSDRGFAPAPMPNRGVRTGGGGGFPFARPDGAGGGADGASRGFPNAPGALPGPSPGRR